MTGTAETEAAEFHDIYKLDVLVIPTNRPCSRKDANDRIYKTRREKYNAVVKEITERHAKGQPMLVGTVSVEASRDCLAACSSARRSRTRCSTRSTTSRRPRSSPAPASAARSPSPRTWPAAAPTSSSAPASPSSAACYVLGTERHEGAPHRPPAARTLRAPGRPRRVAVLRQLRGRSHAHLRRRRAHDEDHGALRPGGRPGTRASVAEPLRRDRAEARRAAQLPDPQARRSNTTT